MWYDNEAEKDARAENQANTYVNKNGVWSDLNGNVVEVNGGDVEESSPTEYLDSVLAEMNEASVGYESFTLDHEDAGMLYDYIEELRRRVEVSEVALRKAPDGKLPALNIVAYAAERFVHYFGNGDTFSDDAIQTYETLRHALAHYKG